MSGLPKYTEVSIQVSTNEDDESSVVYRSDEERRDSIFTANIPGLIFEVRFVQ